MMPAIYRDFGHVKGLPLNWRDETSGVLITAVSRYMGSRINGTSIDEIDVELVRVFLEHYINAPCWNHMNEDEELAAELAGLRSDVKHLVTPDQVGAWINRCLDLGMDPL